MTLTRGGSIASCLNPVMPRFRCLIGAPGAGGKCHGFTADLLLGYFGVAPGFQALALEG